MSEDCATDAQTIVSGVVFAPSFNSTPEIQLSVCTARSSQHPA
jgi:hypothetical protein